MVEAESEIYVANGYYWTHQMDPRMTRHLKPRYLFFISRISIPNARSTISLIHLSKLYA